MTIKEKLTNLFIGQALNNEKFVEEYFFYFLSNLKSKSLEFKINIDTKCLVLSPYPSAEIKGLGGLIAQYPKNFEVLCFTNGADMGKDNQTSVVDKKMQFGEVMKLTRVKGYKMFDIDSKLLKNHYSTFKKIDISEADYIFVPNVFDTNIDTISLLKHFKKMLGEKEYKENLKICMYECDYPLNMPNYYVNISSIFETKKRLLDIYYLQDDKTIANKILGLNIFRSAQYGFDYCETFLQLTLDEFLKIPML